MSLGTACIRPNLLDNWGPRGRIAGGTPRIMGEDSNSAPRENPGWSRALIFAWLAGALAPQVPFQRIYKLGPGNLGYNVLISAVLLALGVLILVTLTQLTRRLVRDCPQEPLQRHSSTWALGASVVVFAATLLPRVPFAFYWVGLGALAVWFAVTLIASTGAIAHRGSSNLFSTLFPKEQRKTWCFNGAFWLLVFIVLLTRDLWFLSEIKGRHGWDTVLIIAGRFLSLATFTVGAILVSQALLALFPSYTRWLVIAGVVLIPLLAIADFSAGLLWQQTLLEIVNNLTLDGELNMRKELEAGGILYSPLQVTLGIAAIIGLSIAAYFALQKVSRRFYSRTGTRRAFLVFGVLWITAIGQQALSMASLRKEIWQAEHATFVIHLGLLRPDPGLETISVQFAETQTETRTEALLAGNLPTLKRKPDIYVVMIETWRADTVTPEIMPFLSKFAREDCQQFELTFAGSNCTPISWFTMFHSRLGINWRDAVAEGKARGYQGAYPIQLLHELGYQCSVRAVCDLGYKQMSDLNFGSGHKFATNYLDNPMLPRGLEIPEREIIIIDDLKKQLQNTPAGGYLHYLALDSAHYNYYWPAKDFEPIHQDCGKIDFGSLKPSPTQIREVVKRYENSVHWIDAQLADFIKFLKEQDRYDNSIIILTGDHGEEFQENGGWFHCSSLKKPQTEVPIMIKWPDWVENQPTQQQVTHLDVMPSVLDALGLDEKYFENLAGHSVLRDHPGEALLSTRWPGKSNIGVCFVKNGLKANFAAKALWREGIPKTLYFMGYANLKDESLDSLQIRGERSHSATLRDLFPDLTGRHFHKFETAE